MCLYYQLPRNRKTCDAHVTLNCYTTHFALKKKKKFISKKCILDKKQFGIVLIEKLKGWGREKTHSSVYRELK